MYHELLKLKQVFFLSLQQHHQTRKKLFEISHSLRSMMYGQDRYRRRYWVLPHCGGVFIEAMESGEGNDRMTQFIYNNRNFP